MERCSFSVAKKNQKAWKVAIPSTPPETPLGGVGQESTKNEMQKDFVKFGTKSFSFAFLFFVLHETKNLSRINAFECGCTQTLDKPFCFIQVG